MSTPSRWQRSHRTSVGLKRERTPEPHNVFNLKIENRLTGPSSAAQVCHRSHPILSNIWSVMAEVDSVTTFFHSRGAKKEHLCCSRWILMNLSCGVSSGPSSLYRLNPPAKSSHLPGCSIKAFPPCSHSLQLVSTPHNYYTTFALIAKPSPTFH